MSRKTDFLYATLSSDSLANHFHIFETLFAAITQSLHMDKLFPANCLSACRDDNRKSCILDGERLSCPAPDVGQ